MQEKFHHGPSGESHIFSGAAEHISFIKSTMLPLKMHIDIEQEEKERKKFEKKTCLCLLNRLLPEKKKTGQRIKHTGTIN